MRLETHTILEEYDPIYLLIREMKEVMKVTLARQKLDAANYGYQELIVYILQTSESPLSARKKSFFRRHPTVNCQRRHRKHFKAILRDNIAHYYDTFELCKGEERKNLNRTQLRTLESVSLCD